MTTVDPVVHTGVGLAKLRILAADAEDRLDGALALPCPAASRISRTADLACLRLGPHEWLVVGAVDHVQATLPRVRDAFQHDLALILDVSDGGVLVTLSGPTAIEKIAAYCDLDLRPASFPTGRATRTRFGDIAVSLARVGDAPEFWLVADQTYTDYLLLLLAHGAAAGRSWKCR